MKKIKNFTVGGLQQKIFNLMLIFILAMICAFVAVSVYQKRSLTRIVQQVNAEQQASITDSSQQTMQGVLENTMAKMTAMQAYMAGDLFGDVKTDVLTLQTFATELFEHADSFSPHPFYPPQKSNDGIPSVQMQHEEGVDPYASESLALVANMSEIMLSMYENSDKLGSCFVGTADGNILFVDDRAGIYFDENGEVYPSHVRERPWYRQAVETGEAIFTGVEADYFSGIVGLVCAAPVYRDGELVAVVGADIFLEAIRDYVEYTASEGSFVCVINKDGQVLFSPQKEGSFKPELSDSAPDLRESDNKELARFVTTALDNATELELIAVDGKEYYMAGVPIFPVGWTVISAVDRELAETPTNIMLDNYAQINDQALSVFEKGVKNSSYTLFVLILVIITLALIGALVLSSRVVKPLELMTRRIHALGEDNLQFKMEKTYRTGDEIEVLAESFAGLSAKTVQYINEVRRITAEKERIGAELALATRIQADMLPNIFPAFPERSEFDVYASMDPAKEVGGDFYDFFLVDDDHLCIVIADVSGKGVPAALFMMATKIILANNAKMGKSPAQILKDANAAICQNNREEMFVTVWLGILEISTGKLTAANAGHEFPALKRADGIFDLVKDRHGFVLGGMDGMKYKEYELQMEPGAKLFLYTDGVPEATNAEEVLFGTARMLEALNIRPDDQPEQILEHVRDAVEDFVGTAEQFDDLTMLCLEYKGKTTNP